MDTPAPKRSFYRSLLTTRDFSNGNPCKMIHIASPLVADQKPGLRYPLAPGKLTVRY